MGNITTQTWKALSTKVFAKVPFLLDPYIPKESITLLFGDTSIGKSPLTWEMARAIATGQSFFGLPTQQARVWYLEVDTPEIVLAPRLQVSVDPPSNVWFTIIPGGMSVPTISRELMEELSAFYQEIEPEVVFINTLRKVHDLDDKDSKTPKIIYSWFQHLFPDAALVFVHHNRKAPVDPRLVENDKEAFSGSKHWLDDAQVGLHLGSWRSQSRAENLRLYHVKSQVSETLKPLRLKLHDNGTTLTSPIYDELLWVYEQLNETPNIEKGELDNAMALRFGMGQSTAKRVRLMVENKLFPGSRAFLGRVGDDDAR